MRHVLGQRSAGGGSTQLEVGNENDGRHARRRVQPKRTHLLRVLVHPGNGGPSIDGGCNVVGVSLQLRADLEDLLAPQHVRIADERTGQRQAGDDCARGGTQASRMRNTVHAAHAHPHLGSARVVQGQTQSANDQVILAEVDVASSLAFDDDRGRPRRRVD